LFYSSVILLSRQSLAASIDSAPWACYKITRNHRHGQTCRWFLL